ncbi:serine-rich adhesin for platelets-like isoform X16 [Haliotis rufescens]|uniref:serine-rich adhesin for platelets-like isoform X16 n=1 Tax=Haliotis rufescens TaxID=6454 RepID=UPI00201F7C72|nr:serine-rich adhesin for platelets-like isoform X16 [Haliotis rufescens]
MCVKAPLSTRDMSPLFFILSLLQCLYLLHGLNHTACYNSELIIDSPLCGNSGNLAPKKFLLGQLSPNSTCRTRLSGQRDYHIVRDCCKFHGGDTVIEEVCIPGQKMRLSSPLSHMARYCSRGHRCDSGKRLTSKELHSGDYVSLEYDCVHVKEEIHFNSDEVLNGRKVYLISDQKDGSVRDAKCAAYKTNPRSSIIVTLVDNIVSSGACTVSFASSMYGSTNINCAKTEIVNGCNNVLYSSNTSRVDINLTMTVIADGSDRQFLWMVVTASDGGNLTVACGTKIPPDDYTTASATQSTRSRLTTQKSSPNYTTTSYSKSTSDYPATIRATNSRGISKSSTLSTSAIATGLTIPHSISGSGGSTKIHLSKTNSMSHSSTGLQLTMSSSPLLTTFGRIQASSTTSTSLSTNMPSSLPPTSSQSHSTTETFSPSLTHSTTGGRLQSSRHTSYSTRPTQGQSLSSFNALSSSNVTLFRLIKTTKPSLHPLTVSIAGGSETAHTSTTSTSASTSTKSWQRLSSTTVTSKPPVDETTRDTIDTEGKGSSSPTVSTIGRMQSSKATSVSSETGQETSSSTTTPMPSTQGGIQHSTTTSSSSITDNGKPSNISTHTSATQHMLTALMFGASTSTKSWQRLSSTTVTSKPPPVDETTRDTMSIAGGSETAHTLTTSTSGRLRFTNITSFSPVDTEGKGSSSTTVSTIGRMQSSKATSVSSETGQETSSSTTTPMPSTQGGIQHSTTTSSSSITDNGKPSNISTHTSATQHMLTALMFGASTSTKSWQRLSSTTVTSKPPVDETTRDTIDTEGKGSSSPTVSTIGRMQSSKATSVSSETGQETSSSTTTPMPSTQGGIQHSTTTSSSSITDNGKPSNISTHTLATQHMLTALMFGASTSTKSWQRLSSTTVTSKPPPVDETTRDTIDTEGKGSSSTTVSTIGRMQSSKATSVSSETGQETSSSTTTPMPSTQGGIQHSTTTSSSSITDNDTEGKGSSSTTVSTIGRMQSSKATSVSSETGQETSSSTTTPMPSTQGGIQHSTTTSSSSITDNGKPSNISTHTSATQHMLTALMFGASTSTKSWQRLSSTTVTSKPPPVDETTRDTMSIAGGSKTAHTPTTSTSGRLRFTNITSFSPVDTEGKGSSSTTVSTIGRMQSSKATSVSSETGQETSSSTTTPMPSTQGGIQHSTTTSSSSITDNGKPSNISTHTSATQHMLTALMFGASTSTKSWQRLSSTTVTSKPPPVDETTRDTMSIAGGSGTAHTSTTSTSGRLRFTNITSFSPVDTEGKGSSSTTMSTIGRMQSSKATSVSSETGQETSSSTTTPMPSTQGGIQHSTTTSSSSITDNGKPSNISAHTSATQHMLTALMFGASTSTKSWQRLSSTTVTSKPPPVDETTRDTIDTEGKGSSSTTVSTIGRMQSSKATSVSSETGQETSSSTTTPMPSTQGGIQHSTTTSSSSITDNGKPSNISTHTSATQHMLTALMFGASTSTKSWQRLSSTTVKSSQPPVDETTRDTIDTEGKGSSSTTVSTIGRMQSSKATSVSSETGQETSSSTTTPMPSTQGGIQHSTTTSSSSITDNGKPSNISTHTSATQHMLTALMFGASTSTKSWQRLSSTTVKSSQPPVDETTRDTRKSDNTDDKVAFILEVITSLTGAALLLLMVITTAMCLCYNKRMHELQRNSRKRKKLSGTNVSALELKRNSVVSLESGYDSISALR